MDFQQSFILLCVSISKENHNANEKREIHQNLHIKSIASSYIVWNISLVLTEAVQSLYVYIAGYALLWQH